MSRTGYKKLEGYGATPPQGGYPAGQGGYPAGQGAYPAGQGAYPGSYQAQAAPPPGWNQGGAPPQGWNQGGAPPQGWGQGGAPPQGWNQGGAPPQGWNQGGAPPPSYASVVPQDLALDDDDHGGPPHGSMPSAPPPEMEMVAGYEGAGYTAGDFLAPPTPFMNTAPSAPPNERPEFLSHPTWSDEEVREALLEYVSQNCCYGSGTAKNMVITNKISSGAYHYILETFGESRQVNWTYAPYQMGNPVDGPDKGRAPAPWEMQATVNEHFKDLIQKMEVPHTSYIRTCHTCSAGGIVTCHKCFGRGMLRCRWCHGMGNRRMHGDTRRCTWCHGHGQVRCRTCNGCGFVSCPTCLSNRNLRFYLELTVTWKNHVEDYISQETSMPSNLIKEVQGTTAFQEAHLRVWPITHFVVPEINRRSADLVAKHGREFPTERILQQRQTVRIVPIMEVAYSWKDSKFNFFVYGLEKKILHPDYPQTCCCGCTIL